LAIAITGMLSSLEWPGTRAHGRTGQIRRYGNGMAQILVLTAHPALQHSRINRRLMQAAQALDPARVAVRDLYALYPDFLIDVQAEQHALSAAQLVVWQHPMHWYGMTPLLKLWLDEVFSFGWAYGPGGTALQGKDLWLVTSTGGAEAAYQPSGHNRHFIDAFWPPYEQTAALSGMRFLPPLVLHGAHQLTGAELDQQASLFADRLARYPDWPELAELPACPGCEVPVHARPET
jgi:glutathione-regulated potassium-efflux system ancillary protein KefF